MTDFDDILKKGKGAAAPAATPKQGWKDAIGVVLYALHNLNILYGDEYASHIHSLEKAKCSRCGRVTYLLTVDDLNGGTHALKFHAGHWKSVNSGYVCDKCWAP